MARIIHDDQGGQSGSSAEGQLTVMKADGQTHIALPEGDFMGKGDILRDGQDLVLQSSDGHEVVIEGYFSAMPSPTLTTPHGSMLTPELVQSFVKSDGPVELAANESGSDASAVGIIKEVSGDATITRTDGTSEKITLGMAVHQGDIIETSAQGAVNVVFLDESSFTVSNNARLAIDEYVFDPATQSGETNVSILRGMFVFTSGLIGRDDPDDVHIETPVGSIGIRGTTIAGHINPDGESQITVVEGAIVIKNGAGETTLDDQYETVTLTGYEQPMQMEGTLDANQMKDSYGMMGTVNAGFFNTLNTEPAENNADGSAVDDGTAGDEPPAEEAPTETPIETAPVETAPQDAAPLDSTTEPATDPTTEGQLATEEPVVATYDTYSDPANTNFDSSVALKTTDPYAATGTTSITGTTSTATTTTLLSPLPPPPPPGSTTTTGTQPPATTVAPPTTTLPPLDLRVEIFVDDDAISGEVVGRAFTTLAFPDVQMFFQSVPLDSGDPIFALVAETSGVYKIVLTDAGENAISTATLNSILGNVAILAKLPDGRETISTAPANYGDFSNTAGGGTTPPPILDLDTITGSNGYKMAGSPGEGIGFSTAYLGDFDRNGSNDFAVSTNVPNNGRVDISGSPTDISQSGAGAADMRVSNSGDLNGDGKLDFLTSTPYYDGGSGADSGSVNLRTGQDVLNTSVSMDGAAASDLFGSSLAMVDFNGDGYSDAFAGAKTGAGGYGTIWRIAGSDATWGGQTFTQVATGSAFGGMFGMSMSALQDVNNDGFGDLAIGGNNFVNIYYGNAAGTLSAPVTLTGITASGSAPVIPIYDLGDVNGNGASDLLIYASGGGGTAYVMYGGQFAAGNIATAANVTITSNMGYLTGAGSAGDFNGDGHDDVFVAIHNGNMIDAFVIYGGALSGTIALDATWLANNQGSYYHMQIDLANHGSVTPVPMSGTGVGDQNGDGFEDLLISSPNLNLGAGGYYVVNGRADPLDLSSANPDVHAVGVNTGGNPGAVASSAGDGLVGDAANNTLSNNNGGTIYNQISFQGGAGSDIIQLYGTGTGMARVIDGGNGRDELQLFSTGSLDFRNISDLSGVEEIAFSTAAAQSLTLGLNDIFSLLHSSSEHFNAGEGDRYTLMITNDGTGTKNLTIDGPGAGGTMAAVGLNINGTYNDGTSTYDIYTSGTGYQLLIEQGVTVSVV